jgi:hypothetical protein
MDASAADTGDDQTTVGSPEGGGAAEGGAAEGAAAESGAGDSGASDASSSEYPGIPDPRPVAQRTSPAYTPIWSPLYELNGNSIVPGSPNVQTSLYEPYDDRTPGWWYNILEEFTYAGIGNSLILTRASVNESPEWLALKNNLFLAMNRRGVRLLHRGGVRRHAGERRHLPQPELGLPEPVPGDRS